MPRPQRKRPSLWPREHGAWFQLGLPMVTALCLAVPTLPAIAFACAGVAAFLLHEPLMVGLGRRGGRVTEALGPSARRRAFVLAALGCLAVAFAFATASPVARLAAVCAGALAAVVGGLTWSGRDKTVAGEQWIGATFALGSVPVATASGVRLATALAIAVAWGGAFSCANLAVHGVIGRVKGRRWARPAAGAAGVAALIASGGATLLPSVPVVFTALAPSAAVTLAITIAPVHPRKLRTVGWTLAATHALTEDITPRTFRPWWQSCTDSERAVLKIAATQGLPTSGAGKPQRRAAHRLLPVADG